MCALKTARFNYLKLHPSNNIVNSINKKDKINELVFRNHTKYI